MKEGFIVIQSWMRDELNLSGNELLVYSVIYGFSQDGESEFSGSRKYLADWCGCSIRNIQNILNDLTERGLLIKTETMNKGTKQCSYKTVRSISNEATGEPDFTGEKISRGGEKISLNNIVDNIKEKDIISYRNNTECEEESSHDYSPAELKEEFLGSLRKKKSPQAQRRLSLYDKCVQEVEAYTKNLILQDALKKYLPVRLAIKDKPIYGVNQWRALLNKLDKMDGDHIAIVEQSIEKGWCSFYPIGQRNSTNTAFSEYEAVKCEQDGTTEEQRKENLRKRGRREEF